MTALSSDPWFLARTQPKRERWAAENVTRQGAEFYLPMTMDVERFVHKGVRRREFRVNPVFPSYLFVRTIHGQWHELLTAFGVVALVPGRDGMPASVRDEVVASVRRLEDEHGMVVLPKTPKGHVIGNGSVARITQGAYTGFKGICQGTPANDRIQILLDYMGRKVPFIVRIADLEAVA